MLIICSNVCLLHFCKTTLKAMKNTLDPIFVTATNETLNIIWLYIYDKSFCLK
jgi:hypothetical protein